MGLASGPPEPGTAVTLRVCAVGMCPEVPVAQLWGSLGQRGAEYKRLRSEIQAVAGPRLVNAPGPVGQAAVGLSCVLESWAWWSWPGSGTAAVW